MLLLLLSYNVLQCQYIIMDISLFLKGIQLFIMHLKHIH